MSDNDQANIPLDEDAEAPDRIRRAFVRGLGMAVGAAALAACGPEEETPADATSGTGGDDGTSGTDTGGTDTDDTDTGGTDTDGTDTDGTGTDDTGTGEESMPVPFPDQEAQEVRWGFLIDLRVCSGCEACTVACKTENDVRLRVFRCSVRKYENGTYPNTKRDMVPWMCNHCANPPCISRCPVPAVDAELEMPSGEKVPYKRWATYQRPDGLVLIDKDRCIGCGYCVEDCPYGARYLDPAEPAGGDPAYKVADKCNLCVQRLSKGVVPACVNTCPGEARMVGNLNDANSAISKKIATNDTEVILPDGGTDSRCYYIGLNQTAFAKGSDPKLRAQLAHPEHHEAPDA